MIIRNILIILTVLCFIPTVYLMVTSRKDTLLAKLGIILSILLTLLSFLADYTINENIEAVNNNPFNNIRSIAEQIEEENYVNSSIVQAEQAFNEIGYLEYKC